MINEKVIKQVIEKYIGSKGFSSKVEREVSDRLSSLLKGDASLKKKIYDARMADTSTKRNLVAEILEEVKHPILSSIFACDEPRGFSAALSDEDEKQSPRDKGVQKPYRRVLKCTFEK